MSVRLNFSILAVLYLAAPYAAGQEVHVTKEIKYKTDDGWTISGTLTTLSALMRKAVRAGHVAANPVGGQSINPYAELPAGDWSDSLSSALQENADPGRDGASPGDGASTRRAFPPSGRGVDDLHPGT